jgi:hypothetical protein
MFNELGLGGTQPAKVIANSGDSRARLFHIISPVQDWKCCLLQSIKDELDCESSQ